MSDTAEVRDALIAHVVAHIGPVAGSIQVATRSGPVEVLHVPATPDKPFHVMVTSGCSAKPMAVPEGVESPAFAELLIALPESWPVDGEALRRPTTAWPVQVLAQTAEFPTAYDGWLAPGHSMPNGDPPQPFMEGLGFCGVIVAPTMILPPHLRTFARPDGRPAALYAMLPVFERELELKLEQGLGALLERFDARGINELLDVHRTSVAGVLIELLNGKPS